MTRFALPLVTVATVALVLTACGSSGHRTTAPPWLHRQAKKQALIFSESDAGRLSRVKLTVGAPDVIELWGRFACNGTNCSMGSCDGLPAEKAHPNGTCVISFRYVRLAVNPTTHRIGLVQKLGHARASWVS
jgi:hypothetical protein